MRTPVGGGPKPALPGSGSARESRGESSDEYPPIKWEELVLGATTPAAGGETAAAVPQAWDDLLHKSGKPVLVHVYRPDEAATNLRIDRILKGEPQFQDSLDKRFFNANFVKKAAAYFRCVRINGLKADAATLKVVGAERVPTALLFDAHGEKKYVMRNPDDTGANDFAAEMDEILKSLGEGNCCFNHREEKRVAYFQALYDQAEKAYQSKDYAPAYLKFHEIEMDALGGRTAAIMQKAEQRQADIQRVWEKDAKEKKRCTDVDKLFKDAVAALKAKKFKEARKSFQAVVGGNQKRGDMHPAMESERILREMDLLDGAGG